MSRVKGKLTTAEYLPIEEFNRLCSCLHEDENYLWELFARLSFCTALRVSDVLTIMWEHILGKDELIKTEKKTKKTRKIRLNNSVRTKIESLYQLLGSPDTDSLIFANPKTNQPYSREHINRSLKVFKIRYCLKIKSFSTHTFRKTFGRHIYETMGRSNEALTLLNRIFQHASINTTMTYIGLTNDEINQAFDHIEF